MTEWRVDHTTPDMHWVCVACGHATPTVRSQSRTNCQACSNGFVVLVNDRQLAAIRKMRESR